MQADTKAWQRVAEAVTARRARRNWTQIDVATRGPLSLDRVQAIEGAKRPTYRAGTIAALERALEWEYGSVEAILVGGEPTPLEDSAAVEDSGVAVEGLATDREPTVAELAAALAEEKRAREDLERRFRELVAQQDEDRERRRKSS